MTLNPPVLKNLLIEYGIPGNYHDVTEKSLLHFSSLNNTTLTLTFPSTDNARAHFFSDHISGTLKHVKVTLNSKVTIYPASEVGTFSLNDLTSDDISYLRNQLFHRELLSISDPDKKLEKIHSTLICQGGNFEFEYPEQLMSASFLRPTDKVLELGSNIGRNTLVIASLLENQKNLVTLESDSDTAKIVEENRNINHYLFHIEASALSKRKLIQKDWLTIQSDILLPGYKNVNIIGFQELEMKYQIKFDTLVCDCEGALYYILLDFPELLNNLHIVLMENDYLDITHKDYVDNTLSTQGFKCIYTRPLVWDREKYPVCAFPQKCIDNFYEVWSK